MRKTPVFLEQKGEKLALHVENGTNPEAEVARFFRWDDPLERIGAGWSKDPVLSQAFRMFQGLRLIRQDPWSCTAGFILATCSNIPKIERTIVALAKISGSEIDFLNTCLHPIPSPEKIASMRERTLRSCGMGFRAPYLRDTAKEVLRGFPLEDLRKLPYAEAKKALTGLPGIGEKVADCILLFSLGHLQAFPVDVWMQRVLEQRYFGGGVRNSRYLSEWGREKFGPFAGYAQQYLYIYARNG